MKEALWISLAAINAVAFLAFGWDKWMARRGSRRISEARLLLFALLLGSPGAWLGVKTFRHKTVKRGFRVRLWLATVFNLIVAAAVVWWWLRDPPAGSA